MKSNQRNNVSKCNRNIFLFLKKKIVKLQIREGGEGEQFVPAQGSYMKIFLYRDERRKKSNFNIL